MSIENYNLTVPYNIAFKALTKTVILNNAGDVFCESINVHDKPYSAKYKSFEPFVKNFITDIASYAIRDVTRDYFKEASIFQNNIGHYLPYIVGLAVGGVKSYYIGQESAIVGGLRTLLYEISTDYKIEPKAGLIDSYGTMILIEGVVQTVGASLTHVFGSKVIKTNVDSWSIFAVNLIMIPTISLYDKAYNMIKFQENDVNTNGDINTSGETSLKNHHDDL